MGNVLLTNLGKPKIYTKEIVYNNKINVIHKSVIKNILKYIFNVVTLINFIN